MIIGIAGGILKLIEKLYSFLCGFRRHGHWPAYFCITVLFLKAIYFVPAYHGQGDIRVTYAMLFSAAYLFQ